MANLSEYGANQILDAVAMPATLYVQLHIGDPGPNGTDDVAVDDRRRSFTRTAAAAGAAENAALLEWLAAPADEDLTHITAWDASTGGNVWWIGAITGAPVAAVTGQSTEIPVGELDLSLAVWT
jgi:hypothetical protein